MKKIKNFLLTCIKSLSGFILLLLVILIWATALFLTTLIEIVNWIENKLTIMMKKCFSDELNKI